MLSGQIVRGENSARAAEAVKRYLGVAYALPVNRGRTALELSLRALGVGAGNDVVLPSYLCRTALDAVQATGANPVFTDVGDDLNVTVDTVRQALTAQTKCVIVPHLFGKAAPIDEIEVMLRETGIALIDDAAQSLGARRGGRLVGTFGAYGIVSCGSGKSLAGAAGGLLVTNDRALHERAAAITLTPERVGPVSRRALSFWIWRRFRRYTLPLRVLLDYLVGVEKEPSHERGSMANLDAVILLCQLAALERNSDRRRRNLDRLESELGVIADRVVANWSSDDVAVKLVLILPQNGPRAGEIIERLTQAGIECQGGYGPLHSQRVESRYSLPWTEAIWKRVVCVPVEHAANLKRFRAALAGLRTEQQPLSDEPRGVREEPCTVLSAAIRQGEVS